MDKRYIPVIDEEPNATKKGLRIKIDGVEVNENGEIKSVYYRYSQYHETGGGIIETNGRNRHFLFLGDKFRPWEERYG